MEYQSSVDDVMYFVSDRADLKRLHTHKELMDIRQHCPIVHQIVVKMIRINVYA